MKIKLKNNLLMGAFILCVTLTGCKDDDAPSVPGTNGETLTEYVSHAGDFYDLSVPGNLAWTIVKAPEWATPDEEGAAGTKINIFVESNADDTDREGVMEVRLSDNSIVKYTIHQYSYLTDDNNAAVSESHLKKTRGAGFSIDVFAQSAFGTGLYPTKYELINPKKLEKYLKAIGETDAFIDEDRYYSESNSHIGSSTSSVANKISVSAGVDAEFGAFKGSVTASFSQSATENEKSGYAIKEIKHVVAARYLRAGILREAMVNGADSIFNKSFRNNIESLKSDPSDENLRRIINLFGTHVIVSGEIGGRIQLALEMHSTEKITERDIAAALEITAAKTVDGGVNLDIKEQTKSFSQSSKISLCTDGGNNIIANIYPGTTYEAALQSVLTKDNLDHFVKTVRDKSSVALIGIKVIPLYSLIDDEQVAAKLHDYILNTYQKEQTGHASLKYAVSGFVRDGESFGSLYLPDIDVRLEYYNEEVPEISTSGSSVIMYSGNSYGMNYDVGFFIGDNSHKPGKLRKHRDGTFSYEPFDIAQSSISEVYVDASGDVMLNPTSSSSDYVPVTFKAGTGVPPNDVTPSQNITTRYQLYSPTSSYAQFDRWTLFAPPEMDNYKYVMVGKTPKWSQYSHKKLTSFINEGDSWINFELNLDNPTRPDVINRDISFTFLFINTYGDEIGTATATLPRFEIDYKDKNMEYVDGIIHAKCPAPTGTCAVQVTIEPFIWGDDFGTRPDGTRRWPKMYFSYSDGIRLITPRWR